MCMCGFEQRAPLQPGVSRKPFRLPSSRWVSMNWKVSCAKLHGVGMAAAMRVRQRQQHAGMVVGVFRGVGDAAVGVQRAHPAAAIRPPVFRR